MFRENKAHLQKQLFNSYSWMNPMIQEQLQKTWAPIYYEHVFCQIDESLLAVLYCSDNGRPNFPVNILLSLEFIKHMKDYTDEEIIEQFYYNYQIMYALGLRNLGELYLAPRTLYEFRERIYRYTTENPGKEDLIFGQFERLTAHFIEEAKVNTGEQRVDSTQIMPNIKRAGRLALAHDVLAQAVKACPRELLSEDLLRVVEPEYKNTVLYRSKGSEAQSRIQEIVHQIAHLLDITKPTCDVAECPEIQLAKRFLSEQATYDATQRIWIVKKNKEIAAHSLQSAYDPDATYRRKAGKDHTGYVLNLAETCGDENPVQFITDYSVEKNSVGDTQMLKERLPILQDKMEVNDLYMDGGYYSAEVQTQAQTSGVKVHYTDMTGRKENPDKVSVGAFTIENQQSVVTCPKGQQPIRSAFDSKSHVLSAHFDLEICSACSLRDTCPVKFQQKDTVLRVSQKTVIAAQVREQVHTPAERKEATSKRAAIEGTNSVLKRAQGAGKLRVRTQMRSTIVVGMKIIGHNIRQMVRLVQGTVRGQMATHIATPPQGIVASI